MSKLFQPELSFALGIGGHERWEAERQTWIKQLEERLGVPLGVRVRVKLRDFDRPFTGILELVVGTEREPRLRLRDERFELELAEIESCERVAATA
ncbi:MAG: hypothetical protein AB1705_10430 [Verrucomicrobiota bacterium]